jgi:hypothetical protein
MTFGRPAVLVGSTQERWRAAFDLDGPVLLSADGPQWVTASFRGVRRQCDGC